MSTRPEDVGTRWNPQERAQKNARILGKRMDEVGIVRVAEACGMSKSWVSAQFNENRDAQGKALAELGLKLVPIDKRCYDAAEIDALLALARKQFARMKSADDLDWDEEHE